MSRRARQLRDVPVRPRILQPASDESPGLPKRVGCQKGMEFIETLSDVEVSGVELFGGESKDVEAAGGGEVVEITEQEAEEECEPMRIAPDPGKPTEAEMEQHRSEGHCPYRSWCEWCVEGRGVGEHHKSGPEGSIPVISFDYLLVTRKGIFLNGKVEPSKVVLKILVVKDSRSKYIGAHVVSTKGAGADRYAVEKLRGDIAWLGYTKVLLKSDNEAAIVQLLTETLKSLRIETVDQASPAHPPAYDSKANGAVENAVRQVQGLLRTLKLCLESRIGKRIPTEHPLLAWLVRHTAWLLTVRVRGQDGRTPYQRLRGKPFARRLVAFGEECLGKFATKGPSHDEDGKLRPRWFRGVFLGYDRLTAEYVLHSHGKVVKTRALQRAPEDRRWNGEALEEVRISPYALYQRPRPDVVFRRDPSTARQQELDKKFVIVRDINLRKEDFLGENGHGLTQHGCSRCGWAIRFGWEAETSLSHSEECRERMREAIRASGPTGKSRVESWEGRKAKAAAANAPAAAAEGETVEQEDVRDGEGPFKFAELDDKDYVPFDAELDAPEEDVPEGKQLAEAAAPLDEPLGQPDEGFAATSPTSPVCSPTSAGGDVQSAAAAEALLVQKLAPEQKFVYNLVREFGGDAKKFLSEVYSVPRVTEAAARLPSCGLVPGFAFDLRTCNAAGKPWDFRDKDMRREAKRMLEEQKPWILVGSPPCTPFSTWQALNERKRPAEKVQSEWDEGVAHLEFMSELYAMQHRGGRYFLHEHPEHANSWGVECIRRVAAMPHVEETVGDQCQYGQQTAEGEPIKKGTRWLSNSPCILEALNRRCSGRGGKCSRASGGTHQTVSGHRVARQSQEYPVKLCKAILMGCKRQLIKDGSFTVGVVGLRPPGNACEEWDLEHQCMRLLNLEVEQAELLKADGGGVFRDSITGQVLRSDLVRKAREEEMAYLVSKGVWEKVPRAEALRRQGKPPITVKWVDVNEGDDEHPKYRSRLVAREVRRAWEATVFSPTPPLEALRTVLSFAATDFEGRAKHVRDPTSERRTQVSVIDIKRAYFNAKTDDEHPTYVELPAEDPDHGQGLCGHLLVHMYGTRRAGLGWHDEFSEHLEELGFVRGDASTCVFHNNEREIVTSVYGDDFTSTGTKADLDWFKKALESKYDLEEEARLGPGPEDDKRASILNRVVRWTDAGLEYEADPRQAEKLVQDLKLEGAKGVGTPGAKLNKEQVLDDQKLEATKVTPFRAVAARANYLAADRPEAQFAAKEICRWMSAPTKCSLAALKRLGRFLEEHRRVVYRFPWQRVTHVDVYSDTDWAGCPRTRKSTSGGCLVLGQHLVKSWSSTQDLVALSSGEAEYYGVTKGSGTGLGYQALLADLGVRLPLRVWTDSTATLGICHRQGLGKLRHLDVRALWLQQKVRRGEVELRKIKGTENPADLFTKHLSSPTVVEGLLRVFGCEYRGGRPEGAPELRRGVGTQAGALLGLLDAQMARGTRADERLLAAGVEDGGDEVVTSKDGHVFPATRCDELGGQLVAEARSYHQSVLPHQLSGDLDAYFPRAVAVDDAGDEDPLVDESLERRGLKLAREEEEDRAVQGSKRRNPLGYFSVRREGQTLSLIRCRGRLAPGELLGTDKGRTVPRFQT